MKVLLKFHMNNGEVLEDTVNAYTSVKDVENAITNALIERGRIQLNKSHDHYITVFTNSISYIEYLLLKDKGEK